MWIQLHFRNFSRYYSLKVLMATEQQEFVAGFPNKCLECKCFVLLMKIRVAHFIVLWPGSRPAFLRKEEGLSKELG